MSKKSSRRYPRQRSPRPIELPEQPPIYAQNPLGLPLSVPKGWVRRSPRHWSLRGQVALAVLLTAMALPLVVAVLFSLLGR